MKQLLVTTLVASAAVTPIGATPVAIEMMHFAPRLHAEVEVEGSHSNNTVPDGDLIQWIVDNDKRLQAERQAKIDAAAAQKAEMLMRQHHAALEGNFAQRLRELHSHVGKTRYVFSGSSPAGWDCSGLTRWFYEGLNIQLEHSASDQFAHGERVSDPLPGDVVAWSRNGKTSGHVGIYAGDGQVIHALRPGTRTMVSDIVDGQVGGVNVYYVRMVDRRP